MRHTRTHSQNDQPVHVHGRRLVVSLKAPEGGGKTDVALTSPKPILYCNTDPNTEDVIEKVFDMPARDMDPEVLTLVSVPYPMVGFEPNEETIQREALDAWDILIDALSPVIRGTADPMPKTVVLDTGTEFNTLNILATFGRTAKIPPAQRRFKMGDVNAKFKGIFRGLEHAGVHVVVPHRVRERWETVVDEVRGSRTYGEEKDRVVPGEYDRVGHKEMGNICNVEVLLMFDPKREGRLSAKFGMRIDRCTIRPALVGKEYWGKDEDTRARCASFPYLATLVYPQTQLSDWE